MRKSLFLLLLITFSLGNLCAAPSQEIFNFYKQELAIFPNQQNRQTRLYGIALADSLETWTLQNAEQPAVQDALFMQARLLLRVDEKSRAVVTLFKLRRLFPGLDVNALLPFLTEAAESLDASSRPEATRLFTGIPTRQLTTWQQYEAEALYELSKLSGRTFYPAAVRAFENFLMRYPNYEGNNEVELWYGDLHRLNGNYLAAIFQYKKADELYPNSPYKAASLRLIGDIYADNLKDPETAQQIYTQVLRQFPNSSETGIVYKHMAILDENRKQYDSALINYDKAIELLAASPAAYEAYRGKADVYVKTKRYEEAYNTLHQTATLFQANKEPAYQALLAAAQIAYRQLHDTRRYTQSLEKALLLNSTSPNTPALMYELGLAYEEQQSAKAKEVYKRLILKYPTDRLATKAQKRLARLGA